MSSSRRSLLLSFTPITCLVTGLLMPVVYGLAADAAPGSTPAAPATQPAIAPEGNVANAPDVLARLANPVYETREAAMEQLICDDTVTIGQLLNLYAMTTVPEQRHRILDVARHVFLRDQIKASPAMRDDAGRVGIKMNASMRPGPVVGPGVETTMGGVRVMATILGFGAHGRIRAGDLITEVNGVGIRAADNSEDGYQANFKSIVQSFKPGTKIELTVFRDGATLRIPIVIGSANAHTRIYHEMGLCTEFLEQWKILRQQFVAIDQQHGWLSPTASVSPENN